MPKPCPQLNQCALFQRVGSTQEIWLRRYCWKDYAQCARYTRNQHGDPVPDNLLPNGGLEKKSRKKLASPRERKAALEAKRAAGEPTPKLARHPRKKKRGLRGKRELPTGMGLRQKKVTTLSKLPEAAPNPEAAGPPNTRGRNAEKPPDIKAAANSDDQQSWDARGKKRSGGSRR